MAHARQSLAMDVAHAFLPDHGAAVICLDRDIDRNRQLVDRLIGVCNQVRHRLPIVGLGGPQSGQEVLAEQVRLMGHPWWEASVPSGAESEALIWASLVPVLKRLAAGAAD